MYEPDYEKEQRANMEKKVKRAGKITFWSIFSFIGLILAWSSFYTVEEGHVGIVKRFSEAKEQVDPGLHIKIPMVDSVEHIEVRTRRSQEALPAATAEQMPVTANVSVNWTVDKSQALDMFKKYGGLQQFEDRILDPRLRSASKTALSKFKAEQLIKERQAAISMIEQNLLETMADFSVSLDSVQIENVSLPQVYLKSIETKQTEKNLADAELHKLERQRLEAQREVNTQQAKADGIEAVSIAKAAAIEREGLAEAAAIEAKAKALRNNPLIVSLTEAQAWNGQLPTMMMGS
jgi:regulator of protease activity HflC (stomatin/prohibitin superfamily)